VSEPVRSGNRWRGTAPAKVNLRLRVMAREETGYHQLETVFQTLDLGDDVDLELRSDNRIVLELSGVGEGELGPEGKNLAVRAARAFLEAATESTGRIPGVGIGLTKRVPHGAGLGGGSSDAAAVLRGLNELHGEPLDTDRLLRVGGGLGADVPFFLVGASRALAWGRGDRLMPLPPLPPRSVVLVVPQGGMATPEAYRLLAEHRERTGSGAAPPVVHDLMGPGRPPSREDGPAPDASGWERTAREAVNDFEPALFPHRPELATLRDALQGRGAAPALLAGSGSAVFGVFESEEEARGAAREIERRSPEAQVILTRTRA